MAAAPGSYLQAVVTYLLDDAGESLQARPARIDPVAHSGDGVPEHARRVYASPPTSVTRYFAIARANRVLLANNDESAHIACMHDEPITLADACELYPRARLTVSTLRAEAERGRLDIFKLGRRLYTTPAAMRAMVTKCQDDARPRASTSIQPAVIGLSATARASSALDSANTTVSELRSASLNTSARNGSPNAAPIR